MRRIFVSSFLVISLASPLGAQPNDNQRPVPQSPVPPVPPAALLPAGADPTAQRLTMPFSDPSRPGTIKLDTLSGSISIKGSNRKDVLIEARPQSGGRPPRRRPQEEPPPGLRRLTQNGPFSVEEDKNTISIDADSPFQTMDFSIEVPLRTNLHVETVMGSVSVEGVEGQLEIDSVNGGVTLTNVGGSVVAHTVNGKLVATITRTTPQQPMAFTSLNGSVDVTLPAAVKANLRLRSDQGDVYTDFDLQLRPDGAAPGVNFRRNGRSRVVDVDNAIYGLINGGGPDFEMRTFNGNVYVRKGR